MYKLLLLTLIISLSSSKYKPKPQKSSSIATVSLLNSHTSNTSPKTKTKKNTKNKISKNTPILVKKTQSNTINKLLSPFNPFLNDLQNNKQKPECNIDELIKNELCMIELGDICNPNIKFSKNCCKYGECEMNIDSMLNKNKHEYKCCNQPCNQCQYNYQCCYGICNEKGRCCSLRTEPCQNDADCCENLSCLPIDGSQICEEKKDPIWKQIVIPYFTYGPTTKYPTTQQPSINKVVTEKPTEYNIITKQPDNGKVTTNEPVTDKPTVLKTTTLKPTTMEPTTKEPTILKSTTLEVTSLEPTTLEPTTLKPTTLEPTIVRTTTQYPTTQEPTTQKPTSKEPTTSDPTTMEPTTMEPTTMEPTTNGPTTTRQPTMIPTKIKNIVKSSNPTINKVIQKNTGNPTVVNVDDRECILKMFYDCDYRGQMIELPIGEYYMTGLQDFLNTNSGFSWILEGSEKCCIHINDDKLGNIIFDGFNRAWNNVQCTKKRYLWHIKMIKIKIDDICSDINIYDTTTTELPNNNNIYWQTTTTTQDPWYRGWNNHRAKMKKKASMESMESHWRKTKNELLSNSD